MVYIYVKTVSRHLRKLSRCCWVRLQVSFPGPVPLGELITSIPR